MPVYQAWNRTGWTDLIVLVTKCLVAAALIAHAHYVNATTLDPTAAIQGSLRPEDAYAHSVPATLRVLLHTAWAAGGYVLASSLVGAVGRLFVWAPAYSLYYCTNVFGLGVALLACALPTAWAVARDGECLAVERACLALDGSAGALCPYTIAGAATAAAAGAGILTSPAGVKSPEAHAFLLRRGLRALASTGANTSPCCYGPEFVAQCSEFLGAAYTQAVVACVLAALVMTQSAVSCFYLCCDCDRDWDSAPRPPPVPKVTLPRLSLEGVKARRASKASESKAAAGGVGNGNGGAGDEASSEQQPAPPAAAGTGPAAMEDGNGHGEA